MTYLGTKPSNQTPTYQQVYEYTATAGQTTFTASYTVGFVSVFRNGVQLSSADYTATNGTSVVLANAASNGDAIRIESVFTANVQGAIPNTAGAVVTSNIADTAVTTAKIADAAVTQAKLAAGVAGNGPAFSAYASVNQTGISSGVFSKIAFDTESLDTNNNFATSRFTPTVAGYYQINSGVQIVTAGASSNWISIFKNGAEYRRGIRMYISSAANVSSSAADVIYMNGSTDYLEIYGFSNGGTWQTEGNSAGGCYFSGSLVRTA